MIASSAALHCHARETRQETSSVHSPTYQHILKYSTCKPHSHLKLRDMTYQLGDPSEGAPPQRFPGPTMASRFSRTNSGNGDKGVKLQV